jgi:hypothetical protein
MPGNNLFTILIVIIVIDIAIGSSPELTVVFSTLGLANTVESGRLADS